MSNLDDHPRNHALLARSRQWRLSPAYDLTPGTMRTETRRDLAMGQSGHDRGRRRPGSFWEEEAEAIAARVFSTVATEWEGLLRRVGVSQAECEIVRGAFLYGGLELPA